jgi:chemotaxis receptor (MCP) glutamine deamidase CheD
LVTTTPWQETVRDLERRKMSLLQEIEDIEKTLAGLSRVYRFGQSTNGALAEQALVQQASSESAVTPPARFGSMSVRWGVLWLLNDDLAHGASTSEIAQKLVEGGVVSKSANFNSNVSAVLSAMRDRGEVLQNASTWLITEDGRQAWTHIRSSRVFLNSNPQ